jgi:hypothetical protein
MPSNFVINGRTYRNQSGKIYRVEGKKLFPVTDRDELLHLERQMDAGQRNDKESEEEEIVYGCIALVALHFWLKK